MMIKIKNNLPPDWRKEKPPTGDWRFLGHDDPRGSHDARGILKKHSQFSPWVLHCVCGRIHALPELPELSQGTAVMIDMIPPDQTAELNLMEGKIAGLPDERGEFPVLVKASGRVVRLPKAWIKVRVFTDMGLMYDERKEFKSRKDDDGFLPPLEPPPPPPRRVNNGRQAMGLFLRNFRKFVKDGVCAER